MDSSPSITSARMPGKTLVKSSVAPAMALAGTETTCEIVPGLSTPEKTTSWRTPLGSTRTDRLRPSESVALMPVAVKPKVPTFLARMRNLAEVTDLAGTVTIWLALESRSNQPSAFTVTVTAWAVPV